MRSYSARQVAQHTGVSVSQIKRWADAGLIVPDLGGGGAKGKHRGYSFRNVFEVAVARECQQFQLPLAVMRSIVTVIRDASMGYLTFDRQSDYDEYQRIANFGAWEGYLLHPNSRPTPWTAVLQYFPDLPPLIIAGRSVSLASRPGYAFLVIPLHDLLLRLELETGDRFDIEALYQIDVQRARMNDQPAPGKTVTQPGRPPVEGQDQNGERKP